MILLKQIVTRTVNDLFTEIFYKKRKKINILIIFYFDNFFFIFHKNYVKTFLNKLIARFLQK